MISDSTVSAMREFISGRDRSIALANRIEVELDAIGGDDEPFAEAVSLLARYRPEGGPFLVSERDIVAILTHVLAAVGTAQPT